MRVGMVGRATQPHRHGTLAVRSACRSGTPYRRARPEVSACGVCRTDLTSPRATWRPPAADGARPRDRRRVDRARRGRDRFAVGDRVGIAWLRRTCGRCATASRGARTSASRRAFTGWDADGGYAEFAVVRRGLRVPHARRRSPTTSRAAAVRRASSATARCAAPNCRRAAGSASTASVRRPPRRAGRAARGRDRARHDPVGSGPTAGAGARRRVSAGAADDAARAAGRGDPVRAGRRARAGRLAALDRGGTLAIAGIHLTDIPPLDYDATCSRSVSCAASRRTRDATARSCSPWRRRSPCRRASSLPARASRPGARRPWRTTGSPASRY